MEIGSYSEIGSLLKRARQEYGLSTEQAAQMMHMRLHYVEALENGDLSALPGLVYTKGYLQTYAAFLRLDKDEILRRFEQVERGIARKGFYFPQVFSREKTPNRLLVLGGLTVAFLVYFAWLALLQPPQAAISPVEPFPAKIAGKTHISPFMVKDVACLHTWDVLYPPCTMARQPRFSLVPLQGQPDTVMQLADPTSR